MDQVGAYLSALFELIGRTYKLDPEALQWVWTNPYSIWLTLGVGILASLSITLGHAVVLLVNQVTGWRFVLGLVFSALVLVLMQVLESVVLWGLGWWWSGNQMPYLVVLSAVLAASAPQVWGFLVLVPYMGTAIGRFLSAWSALCLWALVAGTFSMGRWGALALVIVSWLVVHGLSTVSAPWMSRGLSSMLTRITGRPEWVTGADVLAGRPMIARGVEA